MTNTNPPTPIRTVDVHFHVGVIGNTYPDEGSTSKEMQAKKPDFDVFLLFAGLKREEATDEKIIEKVLETIVGSEVDRVVCLALDHVYSKDGAKRKKESDLWVDNDFILRLQQEAEARHGQKAREKILYGASVHPYDTNYTDRVEKCVADGAVLMKWLPSAQQFSLASPRVQSALKFLATAKNGKPLPLLLHCGMEYAVPTTDERTQSFDFLSWGAGDEFANFWRFGKKKWHVPDIEGVERTINEALEAGCDIIFAHCGLPYWTPRWLQFLEHNDLPAVKRFLDKSVSGEVGPGRCFADLSACVTPFRKGYFKDLKELPEDRLLFGSDFPTPVFEIHADAKEVWSDFKAMLKGDLKRVAIPQGNPIDVNLRELKHAFGEHHSMFINFSKHLL